ncbi:hypothetical protein EOA13_36540 [Mesorhizobium sp. M7A.F.Ca.US.011.01.1.1]|nr:hypothetical protein EOA13_36540 [Mesorhizobium sp. M7A.F.Ca.US.011.01.1.1]
MLQTPNSVPFSKAPLPGFAMEAAGSRRPLPVYRPREALAPRPLSPHKIAAQSAERDEMARAIEQCGGDVTACGQLLGMSRATFYRKLKQYNLSLERQDA